MVVQNGMCYADDRAPVLKIVSVKNRGGCKKAGLIGILGACALCAAGVASAADTWLWIGGSSNTYSGGNIGPGLGTYRDWADGYNWTNLTQGVRGTLYPDNTLRPKAGDFIVFNGAVKYEYTHCNGADGGAFGGITFTNTFSSSYGGQVPVVDGGFVRYDVSNKSVGNQSFRLYGTVEFYVRTGVTVTSHFLQNSSSVKGILRKTGPGTLAYLRANAQATSQVVLEEGTVNLDLNASKTENYTNSFAYLKDAFVFAGPDVTLNLQTYSSYMPAALQETGAATNHRITATGADARLTLMGANQVDTTFSGRITGTASLAWQPAEATTLTLTSAASDSTGALVVSNGSACVATAAAFARYETWNGGTLAFPAGTLAPLASGAVKVEGVAVADGYYAPVARRGYTAASWLAATSGDVRIGTGATVEGARTNAVWTGTGALTTAANWNGATSAPPLDTGATYMQVLGGASATVDADAWLKGIAFDAGVTAFSFTGGAHDLWLGSLGLATPGAGGAYTLEAPIALAGTQPWTIASGDTLTVAHALTTAYPGLLAVTNAGTISLTAGSPDLETDVWVSGGGTVDLKADDALGGASGTTTFSNTTVRLYGSTQRRDVMHYANFSPQKNTTNVFLGKVTLGRTAGCTLNANGGRLVFAGGLEMDAVAGTQYGTAGYVAITNKPLVTGNSHRLNITGELHLWASDNVFDVGQQGYLYDAGTVLYTHVPYAVNGAHIGLAPNRSGGCTWDLCGCDQLIVDGQFGRGNNGSASPKWKNSTQPGMVRSDRPALLRNDDQQYTLRPSDQHSPSATNWAYFVGMAGFSKEGAYKGHWLNQECSSSGTVQVTKGKLYFSKRFVDAQGYDYGQGSWPNAAQAVAKGTGTLVFEHAASIGRVTDVVLDGSGKVQIEEGVSQRCHDLYFGTARQRYGTWGSTASAASHKDDTHFAGTGVLLVLGDGLGTTLIVR